MNSQEIQILVAGIWATLPTKTDHACNKGYADIGASGVEWHNCPYHPDPIHRVSEHKETK